MPLGDYTGGPFYGPFGITALHNSRDDDDLDREALVNEHFADAVEAFDGDEDLSPHHFAAYAKALCLSCHQRSAGALNPEFNDIPGVQPGDDQFLELCSTWTAMSDGVGDNYTDSPTAPKCQRCHMERIADKTVLHKWDTPDELFTVDDGVTPHFDPASGFGPVALEYLNNHAFMGANKKDFGLGKIISGFESSMSAQRVGGSVEVETSLVNKTAHMFPGAHPMRRVLTRIVVTDATGQRLPYTAATGASTFEGVTNQLATLPGESITAGYGTVDVAYDDSRTIVYQGKQADLDGGAVSSQAFDGTQLDWLSPDGTVVNSVAVQLPDGSWGVEGTATVNKIVDTAAVDQFTRLYGRETGKKDPDDSTRFVVRPGFDSNIVRDNRLDPNERETYQVSFDAGAVSAWPVTVRYKVYYMKKGASGKFPTGPDGFLNTSLDPATLKKLAIFEVFSAEAQVQ
jgi:hypothetical protein